MPKLRPKQLGSAALFAVTIAVACSSSDKGSPAGLDGSGGAAAVGGASSGSTGGSTGASGSSQGGTAATGNGSGGGSGSGASGTGGAFGSPNTAACAGLPFDSADSGAACAGVSLEAERVDVDMYIMMDRSVSMADTVGTTGKIRWDFVRDAVRTFVQDPQVANIGVGIQFFGQSGSRDDAIDCDVSRYSTPAVPIGLASQTGASVVAAVDAMLPGGLTPTMPALQGAVAYAKEWAASHPGRATIVVLFTDGYPTQCQNPVSVSAIADVAKQAAETVPPVRTYAVGLAAGSNLDTIARAGGTNSAFRVDEGDITQSFASTLLNISSGQIACEYALPTPADPNTKVDLDKLQAVYTPAVGAPEEIPRAQSASDCASSTAGGWYYDDPTNPSKILVCPCTCSRFAAGSVEIRLGCAPRRINIR